MLVIEELESISDGNLRGSLLKLTVSIVVEDTWDWLPGDSLSKANPVEGITWLLDELALVGVSLSEVCNNRN